MLVVVVVVVVVSIKLIILKHVAQYIQLHNIINCKTFLINERHFYSKAFEQKK